jgi:hypothetical protein
MYAITWRIDTAGNLVVERQTDESPRDIFEALEALTANDSYGWLRPEEIAALTDAPIIGQDVARDDSGELVSVGAVFWYPQYETTDPIRELMERGRVIFTRAPDSEQ